MIDPTSAAYLGAAGISAGGSLLGSLLGIGNQKSVIKAQQRMQRESMAWQTNERVATQQYNTDMWNKQNEYNTASAQRQRLEAAGLNPYMMMSGGDAGSASSVTGSYTGAPSSPNYQAYDIGGNVQSAFRQIGEQLYNMRLNRSQVDKNNSESAKAQSDALLSAALTKDSDAFREQRLLNLQAQEQNILQDTHLKEEDTKLRHSQYIYQNLDNTAKRIMNKYLDAQQQAQLMGVITSINEAYTRMDLNAAKAKEARAAAFEMYMGGKLKEGELNILTKTMDSAIDRMNIDNLLESQLMLGEFEAGSKIGFGKMASARMAKEFQENKYNYGKLKDRNNLINSNTPIEKLIGQSPGTRQWKRTLLETIGDGKLPFFNGIFLGK